MYLPRFNGNFISPSIIPSLLLADSSDLDSSGAESAKCSYLRGMIFSPAIWQHGSQWKTHFVYELRGMLRILAVENSFRCYRIKLKYFF